MCPVETRTCVYSVLLLEVVDFALYVKVKAVNEGCNPNVLFIRGEVYAIETRVCVDSIFWRM